MDPNPPLPSWCCKRKRTTRVLILASPSQSTPEKDQESSISSTEEERGQKSPLASTVVDTHNHHIMSDDGKNHQIDNSPHRHVCSICGKSFGTHQALGGHKSTHRVIRSPAQPRQRGGGMSHSCRTCGAIFGTGHQLGGHMRKHYNPLKRTREGDNGGSICDDRHGPKISDFNNGGSICEAVPMFSDSGAYVSSQGGADVDQKPVTEEVDLELRLWFI